MLVGVFSAIADGNLIMSPRWLNAWSHSIDRVFATSGGIYFFVPRLLTWPTSGTTITVAGVPLPITDTMLVYLASPIPLYCLITARNQSDPKVWFKYQVFLTLNLVDHLNFHMDDELCPPVRFLYSFIFRLFLPGHGRGISPHFSALCCPP